MNWKSRYLASSLNDGSIPIHISQSDINKSPCKCTGNSCTLTVDDPRHGTVSGYTNLKCRCQLCRATNTERKQKLVIETTVQLLENPNDPRHGKASGAQSGCLCDACRKARSITQKKMLSKAKEEILKNPDDPRHGRAIGSITGCKCDKCKDYRRNAYQRTKAKVLKELQSDSTDPRHGTNHGYAMGCRCVPCIVARRIAQEKYYPSKGVV